MIPGFSSSELSGTKLSKLETVPIIGVFFPEVQKGLGKQENPGHNMFILQWHKPGIVTFYSIIVTFYFRSQSGIRKALKCLTTSFGVEGGIKPTPTGFLLVRGLLEEMVLLWIDCIFGKVNGNPLGLRKKLHNSFITLELTVTKKQVV